MSISRKLKRKLKKQIMKSLKNAIGEVGKFKQTKKYGEDCINPLAPGDEFIEFMTLNDQYRTMFMFSLAFTLEFTRTIFVHHNWCLFGIMKNKLGENI